MCLLYTLSKCSCLLLWQYAAVARTDGDWSSNDEAIFSPIPHKYLTFYSYLRATGTVEASEAAPQGKLNNMSFRAADGWTDLGD